MYACIVKMLIINFRVSVSRDGVRAHRKNLLSSFFPNAPKEVKLQTYRNFNSLR